MMMKVTSLRLSEEQQAKLTNLTAKTGYTSSEIVRKIIDNLDEVSFKLAVTNEDKNRKVELAKIAELKYKNYLFSNVTSNINQIAHYVNANSNNVDNASLLNAFQTVEKQIKDVKEKINNYGNN